MAGTFFRAVFLYLVLIVTVRLMGKRQVGQMEPSEFVVTMLLADLASIPMDDSSVPLSQGILPMAAVLATELVLSVLSRDSILFRKLLCGKPVILIQNGKLLQKNLRKTRITPDELSGHLRIKDVLDITTVQYAILETNGELSVFLWPKHQPPSAQELGVTGDDQSLPVTIIEDGSLLPDNLKISGKDGKWVERILRKHHATAEDTFLLTVDGSGKVIFIPKE